MPEGYEVARQTIFQISETLTSTMSATFVATVQQALHLLVPGDLIGWVSFDLGRSDIGSRGIPQPAADEGSRRLRAVLHDHPMVAYIAHNGGEPKRISDLVSMNRLRATRTYAELMKPLGYTYQAAMVTSRRPPAFGTWMINRSDSDFSDREMERLTALHGPLCALERASSVAVTTDEEGLLEARSRARLSQREVQVVELLAAGLTATAIGHRLRISPATVRKHLEHVYDKLGCRDRLMAVQRSRQLGLLPAE